MGEATFTITDDDAPAATIAAGTSPVTEGTAASFTVKLSSAAPSGGLTVNLTVADATGSDFVAAADEGAKTLAFAAGDTSKTYEVATVADTTDEASGDVTLTVASGTGYTVGSPSSATVTVNDDDAPAATIKAGTSPVTEGTGAAFTVELSTPAPSGGLTVNLTVADATGSDFVASTNEGSKTLAFDAGDTSKTYTVATVSDTVDEANGDVTVTVGTGTGYTVGSPSEAKVTVNDNDAPAATIAAGTSPVTEGTAASFTVKLSSAAPSGGLTVNLTVADASGSDFVAAADEGAKTLAFAAGDTSKTYEVATVADTTDEATGDVTVTLASGDGYTIASPAPSASVTVNDDDAPAATIAAGTSPVTEGTAASFTVTLSSAAPEGGLTVALTVADGGEVVAAADEGAKTLAFAAGDTSKTYEVATVADVVDEDNADVTVTVASGTGYTVGTPSSAKVTVNDDDDAPQGAIGLSLNPTSAGESADATTVTVTATLPGTTARSEATALTVKIGKSGDAATEGTDYGQVDDVTLTIPAGSRTGTATFSIDPAQDTLDEGTGEALTVHGTTSVTGFTVGEATFTITDDDAPAATIAAGTSPVTEGTAASFTVKLSSAAPSGGLTVNLTVADATGSDFVAAADEGAKTLAFAAGDTSKTYEVATVADTTDEASGDVTLTVASGTGYTVGSPSSATVTVNDDDAPAATIKAGTSPVTEGTGAAFTVELSTPAPSGGLTVNLTVADATGSDFVASTNEGSKTLAFDAGDTSKTYTVATVSDTVDEANGDVTVTVGTGTGYTVGSPSEAKVTVNDNDAPAATIAAGTSPVTEGTAASFTVKLSSAAPSGGLTVNLTVADASGSDFVAAADEGAKTLAFAAGDTSKTYEVATVADTTDEATGDVTVTLASGDGYTIASPAPSASVTVNDDDAPAATIAAGTSPVTEGTAASFTVTLSSAAPEGGLTVALTVADGGEVVAAADEGAKTLAFAAGDTSKTYEVATVADVVDEDNADVTVTVASGTGYTVGTPSSAKVTVNDDDDAPQGAIGLSLNPTSAGESADATTVTVTATLPGTTARSEATALTVKIGKSGDAATEGTDYGQVDDVTLTIPAGSRTGTATFSIDPAQDTLDEGTGEALTVHGTTSVTGFTVGEATFTITDDDAPAATIAAGTSPVTEGTAASFTVKLSSAAPSGGLTVNLTVADATGSDFVAAADEGAKTLAFAAGDTSKTYEVATVADTTDEASGDVTLTVASGTGYTVGSPSSATVTVNDDDLVPAFNPANGAVRTDAGTNITLTFLEAVKKDTDGVDFANADLQSILALKSGGSGGANIAYSARINSAKTVITIDPSSDLSDGSVYVAISNAYYNAAGDQGSRASATFTVDATPPAPTFSPVDGATVTDAGTNITLTFAEAVKKDGAKTDFTASDLSAILTLKSNDGNGADIPYSASIDAGMTVITINPSADLDGGSVYVAISGAYYDAAGNQGRHASVRFTVATASSGAPGKPVIEAVETGPNAPTATTASFMVSCAAQGDANITDYTLRAVAKDDRSLVREQEFPPEKCGSGGPMTLTGLPPRPVDTTWMVTARARAISGENRHGPSSDPEEVTTLADAPQEGAPALTAAFENVPPVHTGNGTFSFLLRFSVPLDGGQEPTSRSFETSHGAVAGLARVDPADSTLWQVDMRPITWREVGVVLRGGRSCDEPEAVCASGGRALSNSPAAKIGAAARIDVSSHPGREGGDKPVRFGVTLSRAPIDEVRVDYATRDGQGTHAGNLPATAGSDYTATSGTVVFAPGETKKWVEVEVIDDAVDEDFEYFWLLLSNPRGAYLPHREERKLGLIMNDDPLQKMWLSRFGRTVGGHVTDAVSERLAGLAPGAHAQLAGQPLDLRGVEDDKTQSDAMTGLAQHLGAPALASDDDPFAYHGSGSGAGLDTHASTTATTRSMSAREALLGSSFHVAPERDGPGPFLAAWGRVTQGGFDGEETSDAATVRLDGEVVTGTLGADADWGRVLAGVAVSFSEGEGTFDQPGVDSGSIESAMTTVSPYARFRITERVSAWGVAGWGTGTMTITQDTRHATNVRPRAVTKADLSMQMGGVGARGALLEQDESGGMDLGLKADAMFVRTESESAAGSAATEADASRLRLVLEAGRSFSVSDTATLRPSLELGLRHDGGDAETGAGVDIGGGIAWADTGSGLSIEARAQILVAHAASDYEEWGASATARLDPGARGRGLSFSLSPTLGAAPSAPDRLWGAHDARALAPDPASGSGTLGGAFRPELGLTAEAGYGFPLFGDRFTGTPNLGFSLSNGGGREYRVSWRLTSAVPGNIGFEFSLEATRREPANDGTPEHGLMLRNRIRW